MNKITTQVKVVMLLSIFVLVPNIIFAEQVTATPEMIEPETSNASEITQAYPTEDKYWFLNIFTENNVEEDYFDKPTNIQYNMDYWNNNHNSSNNLYGRTFALEYFYNESRTPQLKFFDIYSSVPQISCVCCASQTYEKMTWHYTGYPITLRWNNNYVKGGYRLYSWNGYKRIWSNTSLWHSGSCFDECSQYEWEEAEIDYLMEKEFNISDDLLLNSSDLTAFKLNENFDKIPIDNPLYFNATQLFNAQIGDEFKLNAYNLTMSFRNSTYYKLTTSGPNQKNLTIYIKPSGEVWCYEIDRTYSTCPCDDCNTETTQLLTSEKIQFWLGWHHYVPVYSFEEPNDSVDWEKYVIIGGISAVAIAIPSGIIIKRRKGKNEEQ